MADIPADGTAGIVRAADGRPLKVALARAQARARRRAFLLVLPLLAFVLITFVIPIGQMLHRSVHNPTFVDNMPAVSAWFRANPVGTEPDEAAFAALASDLAGAAEARTIGAVGTRVNYEMQGTRSLFTSAGRRADDLEAPFREAILELDAEWGDPELWNTMRHVSTAYTANFYLAAVDRFRDLDGSISRVAPERQVYLMLFQRTFLLSALITALCLLLGFPIAHLLATLPLRYSNLLMILVLLPFWTSLLVRTTAWMVILQGQGVLNNALVALGIVGDGGRVELMYNQAGTVIAMTHILLPFMVLPLYSVMRTINPSYVRAARSLGATSWTAFRRVYLPQTLPGVGAGVAALLHPRGRLLHHPGAGRRRLGAAHLEPDRLPHAELAQLVAGGGAGDAAARRRAAALLALRPAGRHRQHEARVTHGPARLRHPPRARLALRLPRDLRPRLPVPDRADHHHHPALLQRRGLLHLHREDAAPRPRRLFAALVRPPPHLRHGRPRRPARRRLVGRRLEQRRLGERRQELAHHRLLRHAPRHRRSAPWPPSASRAPRCPSAAPSWRS